jgi:hypothetical protein
MPYATVSARFVVVASAIMSCAVASHAMAQAPAPAYPDSAQIMASTASGMRMMHPAEFLLSHQAELALTNPQITELKRLAAAQTDSNNARMARRFTNLRLASEKKIATGNLTSGFEWTGTLDEDAIRASIRATFVMQEDEIVNLARDRHAAGAVLTPVQVAMITKLEASDLLKSARN